MVNSILIVEDEEELREYLTDILLDSGFSVTAVDDGSAAIHAVEKKQPDLVLLDLGLPSVSGEAVCREIRKNYPDLPVIILTARSDKADIVKGLNLGADDYMTKPFEKNELLARINARLRHVSSGDAILKVGNLTLDPKTFEVKRRNRKIHLSPQEYKLLEYLMRNKGRIVTREMILNRIWLYSPDIETRVVDVYIGYLRRKIEENDKKRIIHSTRGFGYMIQD